jgi:hypothetical protein
MIFQRRPPYRYVAVYIHTPLVLSNRVHEAALRFVEVDRSEFRYMESYESTHVTICILYWGNCIITNFKKREMLKFPQHQSTPIN